jgi:adenine-specific DNA-methyltransferase
MKINAQTPKIALNKAFLKQRPIRSEIELFKANLKNLLAKVETKESEENKKNHVRDFLLETYYKATNEINTKDRKDLVIHLGKTNADKVGVIIEAKTPESSDMVKREKLNAKAFHELVLYYFDERIGQDNAELKNLIITNTYEWFIFDANVFDKQIYRNNRIKKLYETYKNDKKDNPFFYEELRKLLDNTDETLDCVYFNLKNYETFLNNDDLTDDKNLIELQKILSPFHLLKTPFTNDSNSLNKPFYDELLHIIGLEEIKDKSKTIIRRKLEGNRNQGSLLENAISIIETEDSLFNISDIGSYGEKREDRLFNVALELCITWINRILFLKLLESQLVGYHKGNKDYRFLNVETISDFDELYKLFHQVLAVNTDERKPNIKEKYARVPYLNSSLFEFSDLEKATLRINQLDNNALLEFNNSTILKDLKTQGKTQHTLEYLFKFLDAYDFASEGFAEIQENNRSLINASILGKIFEKINGYKDGSIFTPSFITMYMCRQSIRLAVVQKFKEKYQIEIDSFDDLKNFAKTYKTEKILEYNAVINSIKLCDPAVGSGHFLVSSLNEIIAIKSELGILADENGDTFSQYQIHIENDELIITDEKGEFFAYQINDNGKPNNQTHKLQRTLFHEKQTLIENCLFGVDINPNSVKICRLRLWIELLKNAYYKESGNYGELETLPNIDINIKCGNSLISRFALDADLSQILKQIKYNVNDYRSFVLGYKETKDREKKRDFEENIRQIKTDLKTQLFFFSPERRKLADLENQLKASESKQFLFGETDEEKAKRLKVETDLKTKIAKAKDAIKQVEENAIYRNAFEWRFEFPEVLDNDGNFLGFDIVIGNPPYGVSFKDNEKMFLKFFYQNIHIRTPESYNYFVRRFMDISKINGFCHLIIPSSFLNQIEFEKTRKLILETFSLFEVINLGDDVFVGVTAPACIIGFENVNKEIQAEKNRFNYADLSSVDRLLLSQLVDKEIGKIDSNAFQNNPSYNFINRKYKDLFEKCYQDKPTLKDITEDVATGISSGLDKAYVFTKAEIEEKHLESELLKDLVIGGEVHRFTINPISTKQIIYITDEIDIESIPNIKAELLKYRSQLTKRREAANGAINWYSLNWARRKKLFDKPKIIIRQTANRIIAAYDDEKWYGLKSCLLVQLSDTSDIHYFYLLSLLNSSLMNFLYQDLVNEENRVFPEVKPIQLFKLPIKQITPEEQKPFIELVDKILEKKKSGEETSELENQIDAMVYKLYELSADEIKIVEGK